MWLYSTGYVQCKPSYQHTAVSYSKFFPGEVVLYIAATLCLSYSIASHNTAAIKWLNHQLRAAFLTQTQRNSCSTALGVPFLWHLLGTNCLPGSCWHIQTVLLLQLLRAEAWKAQTSTKLQILQCTANPANPTSALYIHTCEDFTFYVTFRIPRQH